MINKKSYKNCDKILIGSSDCAKLYLVGGGLRYGDVYNTDLCFGEDGVYYAYLIEDDTPIPEHYHLECMFKGWVSIFNEKGHLLDITSDSGSLICFYRAGDFGCIIKLRPINDLYFNKVGAKYHEKNNH